MIERTTYDGFHKGERSIRYRILIKRVQCARWQKVQKKERTICARGNLKEFLFTRRLEMALCPCVRPTVSRSLGAGYRHRVCKRTAQGSEVLRTAADSMPDMTMAGKQVICISAASNVVDVFDKPDDRMMCPHFDRPKPASNGYSHQCAWCYLKSMVLIF